MSFRGVLGLKRNLRIVVKFARILLSYQFLLSFYGILHFDSFEKWDSLEQEIIHDTRTQLKMSIRKF